MRVFITWTDLLVEQMFKNAGWEIVKDFDQPFDFLCLPGGIDINPFLYGERPKYTITFNTRRDNAEIRYWKKLSPDFPKIGICRGAQLGNVLSGGTLWQDVDNHYKQHLIKDMNLTKNTWKFPIVSSDHHQMCRLTEDAILLAAGRSSVQKKGEYDTKNYGIQTGHNNWEDPEAFYYINTNFLGVQFHPEYPDYKMCREYFWDLVDECFDLKKMQEVRARTPGERVLEK